MIRVTRLLPSGRGTGGTAVTNNIDLGHDHSIRITVWDPDLDLNPTLRRFSDQFPAKIGGIVEHKMPDGSYCEGSITFDVPLAREFFKGPYWKVESWDPLTLSPSLRCHCGDHGFIQKGQWVVALYPAGKSM
jgi:hypothetical protein